MRSFALITPLLLILISSLNLTASPDLGVYEYERPFALDALQAYDVDFSAMQSHSDVVLGASSYTEYLMITDDHTALVLATSSRSSRWWLTDACLRQLLAPIPI